MTGHASGKHILSVGGGGPPAVTSFADTLIGVDRPFYIGDGYYMVGLADSTNAPIDWAAQVNIGGSGLTYGNGGGVNNNGMFVNAFPSAIDYAATKAKSLGPGLFAQFTIGARTAGIDCSLGIFLMGTPGSTPCYFVQVQSQTNNTPIYRKDNVGSTNLVASTFTNALNDVFRLECRYVAGSPELRSYQNGVLRNTFTDSSAQKITGGGVFGLCFSGVFTGQLTISNFSGGTL